MTLWPRRLTRRIPRPIVGKHPDLDRLAAMIAAGSAEPNGVQERLADHETRLEALERLRNGHTRTHEAPGA